MFCTPHFLIYTTNVFYSNIFSFSTMLNLISSCFNIAAAVFKMTSCFVSFRSNITLDFLQSSNRTRKKPLSVLTSRTRFAPFYELIECEFLSLFGSSVPDSHIESVLYIRTETAASGDSRTNIPLTDESSSEDSLSSATNYLTFSCTTLSASRTPRPLRYSRLSLRRLKTVTSGSALYQSGLQSFLRRFCMILGRRKLEKDS